MSYADLTPDLKILIDGIVAECLKANVVGRERFCARRLRASLERQWTESQSEIEARFTAGQPESEHARIRDAVARFGAEFGDTIENAVIERFSLRRNAA